MRKRILSFYLSGFLAAAGFWLFFSIVFVLYDMKPSFFLLDFPGSLLLTSYSLAAFHIPVYLFGCSFLLILRSFRKDILFILLMSIIPFVTTGILLRMILPEMSPSPATNLISSVFGVQGGILFLFLTVVVEIMVIISLHHRYFGSKGESGSEPQKTGKMEKNKKNVLAGVPYKLKQEAGNISKNELPPKYSPIIDDSAKETFRLRIRELSKGDPENEGNQPDAFRASKNLKKSSIEANMETRKDKLNSKGKNSPNYAVEESEIKNTGKAKKGKYLLPDESLLNDYNYSGYDDIDEATIKAGNILKNTLAEFKIEAEVTGISKGPVITMFEILPAPGVKLSKIVNLADNIALRLAASRVRIVAPIPGKHAVGIEVPNRSRAIVSFKEIASLNRFKSGKYQIPIILGKDIAGGIQLIDLVQTPHLLIAGATGSGKSVCVNSMIASILYSRSPEEIRLLLIDPKIVELKFYNDIPHLLTPVITDPKKAFQALQYCIYEMERRYSLLDSFGARDIQAFNQKVKGKSLTITKLPYIVVVIDEFADLMSTTGKELESTLARLAAMSRAVGIHLVLATQRPSIDVITGLIKANIPSRIAFMVASKFDSRIIIDSVGAEKLLGKGDMLFASAWEPFPVRIQGAYLSDDEVERITEYVKSLGKPDYIDDEIFIDDDSISEDDSFGEVNDPLMEKALEIVVAAGKASASYLQRRLKIGYNRAARIVEDMEARGIVGPQNGSKPREVIHIPDKPET